jgi:hypothetical protein
MFIYRRVYPIMNHEYTMNLETYIYIYSIYIYISFLHISETMKLLSMFIYFLRNHEPFPPVSTIQLPGSMNISGSVKTFPRRARSVAFRHWDILTKLWMENHGKIMENLKDTSVSIRISIRLSCRCSINH